MTINYCPNCGNSIHGRLRFCSKCGANFARCQENLGGVEREDELKNELKGFIETFIESNADLLKELAAKVEKGERFEKGMFFAVEMKGGKPVIKSGDIEDLRKLLNRSNLSLPFNLPIGSDRGGPIEFRQENAQVQDTFEGKRVTLRLPGVSSLENVSISLIEDGVEIIARGRGRVYFSKAQLKGLLKIKSSRLEGDILTIDLT